ncbi:hypothetical protein [Rhodococcus spongiicola]|uniref:Uncharacterized protein n=1 Tax=Rhodococcus spongiicola TaxID=2487352 RepID=A0A438ANM8_9NOCA|nr:hypothetical protein [Rhodococcus spongiicola]RVW00423.1 hypothetical protein EF834_17390 [Rhodococcus spongiicola]
MGFIRKAMAVVAVTSGLVAGGSGIAQANTATVEPSVQAVSAMASPAPVADTGAGTGLSSVEMVFGSVGLSLALPFILTASVEACMFEAERPDDNPPPPGAASLHALCSPLGSS